MNIIVKRLRFLLLVIPLIFLAVCGNPSGTGSPPVPAGTNWRMVVMGDSRNGLDIFDETIANVLALDPQPVATVHLGDFIRDPDNTAIWTQVNTSLEPIRKTMQFFPVPGNHDIKTADTSVQYRQAMNINSKVNYYRKDLRGAHLIFLDGTITGSEGAITGDQLVWLKAQLDELATSTDYKLIFCHFIFLPGIAGNHAPMTNADELRGLFQAAGVHAVFSAHNHFYAHQQDAGIDYFTTGGAGAPFESSGPEAFYQFLLLNFTSDQLVVQAIGLNGEVKDTVTIPR